MSEYVAWINRASREQAKYEAIGGHRAAWSGVIDPDGRERCRECNRPLTFSNPPRHYTKPRRRAKS